MNSNHLCFIPKTKVFQCNTVFVFSSQLDQLVIDSAVEKREMEHKHATIQQRVRTLSAFFTLSVLISHKYNLPTSDPQFNLIRQM